MKTCSTCGANYSDRIDFCFEDGAVLALPQAFVAPQTAPQEPDVSDAPAPPPRLVRHDEEPTGDDGSPPTVGDAPPIKRRRSLLGPTPGPTPAPSPQRAQTPLAPIAPPQPEVAEVEYEEEVPTPEPRSAPRAPDANRPMSPTQEGTSEALPWFEPAAAEGAPASSSPAPAGGTSRPASSAADLARVGAARSNSSPPPAPLEVREEPSSRPGWMIPVVVVAALLLVVGGGFAVVALGIGGAALTGAGTEAPKPGPQTNPVAVPVASGVAAEVPVEAVDTDVAMIADTDAAPAEGTADPIDPAAAPAALPAPAAAKPPVAAPAPGTGSVTAAPATPPAAAPQLGKVTFESTPPGAIVTVDGANKGAAPVTVELPYGAHAVSFELSGHGRVERTVDVKAAADKLPVTLEAEIKIGKVFVALPGRDGQILYVDGRKIGPLPQSVDLTEGSHAFAVEAPDATRVEVTREVKFTDGRAFINL